MLELPRRCLLGWRGARSGEERRQVVRQDALHSVLERLAAKAACTVLPLVAVVNCRSEAKFTDWTVAVEVADHPRIVVVARVGEGCDASGASLLIEGSLAQGTWAEVVDVQ